LAAVAVVGRDAPSNEENIMQALSFASERRALTLTGLTAPPTATTLTSVLNFSLGPGAAVVTGPLPLTSWATLSGSAADGTRVKITKRGVYQATLAWSVPASQAVAAGIAVDAADADLVATVTPADTVAGVVASASVQTPASTITPLSLSAVVLVTDAMAGAADQAVIRFLANNNAGGAAAAGALGLPRARISYLGDLQGG
jgi:hypothetical protein